MEQALLRWSVLQPISVKKENNSLWLIIRNCNDGGTFGMEPTFPYIKKWKKFSADFYWLAWDLVKTITENLVNRLSGQHFLIIPNTTFVQVLFQRFQYFWRFAGCTSIGSVGIATCIAACRCHPGQPHWHRRCLTVLMDSWLLQNKRHCHLQSTYKIQVHFLCRQNSLHSQNSSTG